MNTTTMSNLASFKYFEKNRKIVENIMNIVQGSSICPKHCSKQLWTDDIGRLVKVVLIDQDTGKKAFTFSIEAEV